MSSFGRQSRRARDRAIKDHDAWAALCMKRYGWYVHYVAPGVACAGCKTANTQEELGWPEGLANHHTHGFFLSWKHHDFQIVLDMDPRTAHGVFAELAERVEAGERYAPGIVTGLVRWQDEGRQAKEPMRARLVEANEEGRTVLRILLPDAEGRLPGEPGCDPPYSLQEAFDSNHKPKE